MLQIINPRPLHVSHAAGSGEANIGIVVSWEDARPLIKELEQTVNIAERKYGDLIQQLNFCKEYYEKWSAERCSRMTSQHKRKTKKRSSKRKDSSHSSSEGDSVNTSAVNSAFSEKIRNKIFEIANEIKEANRKIMSKEIGISNDRDQSIEREYENRAKEIYSRNLADHITKSETIINDRNHKEREESVSATRTSSNILVKKRQPILRKRQFLQKYKLRSKSLPQGVKRKFGFGSFVEIVDNQRLEPKKVKSKGTVSSGSKSNLRRERGRSKSRSAEKLRIRERNKNAHDMRLDSPEASKTRFDIQNPSEGSKGHTVKSEISMQNVHSCINLSTDFVSTQTKPSSTYLTEIMDDKMLKGDNFLAVKKSLSLASKQPIPFTICRTTKTFNLGLNIQQVLSLIKSKRHSSMLQTILKDKIHNARLAIHKTEQDMKALYIATSSRLARTEDSETCPIREDTERCLSVISSTGTKCKMLTCRQSMREGESESISEARSISVQEIQRPEDVWIVEQPDSHQSVQHYRSRCTCYPMRHTTDYQKVLKKYLTLSHNEQKTNFNSNSFCSPFSSDISVTEINPMTFNSRFDYQSNRKLELRGIQEDLENLIRRYELVQEHVAQHSVNDREADAELDAFELELNYREEDWKTILNYYKQVIDLKRKVSDLRGRIKNLGSMSELNRKPTRTRKDPLRPTPSMTLKRVLRQIQCLQDKIKLIDSPSIV